MPGSCPGDGPMKVKIFLLFGGSWFLCACSSRTPSEARNQQINIAIIGLILFSLILLCGFIWQWWKSQKENSSLKAQLDKLNGQLQHMKYTPPGTAHAISRGNDALHKKDYRTARLLFFNEIGNFPDQANAWMGLALAYSGLDEFEDALHAFECAVSLDEQNPMYNTLAQVSIKKAELLVNMARYPEAKNTLEMEVLPKNPDSRRALELLEKCNKDIRKKR